MTHLRFQREGREGSEDRKGCAAFLEDLARTIVDSGLKVHRTLGPGLLESAYEHFLTYVLQSRGLSVCRQVALPVVYEGARLEAAYRLDMVVNDAIIVEVKAVEALTRMHGAQLLTYLRLSGIPIGFLMNFNAEPFKHGLKRMVYRAHY